MMNTQPKEVTYIEASFVWDIAQYNSYCRNWAAGSEAQSVYCNRLSLGVALKRVFAFS
jgi:hypothetical protein